MAQAICTRPARQTAAAATTTTSVASATSQTKTQGQHAANGPVAKTIPKPLSLCQPQSLLQKQSLAFAQIMLHASRPDSNISYGDFVDGSSGSEAEAGKRGQPLKIILRGCNPKADSVLNLLEHGIFDALEKNVLEAVQLTVFVDKENPSHVLETYTFSFNYTEGGINELKRGLEAVSLETNVLTTGIKTFRTAKQGLEMIIRRLITLSTFLPILPNKRFLEIHLFYTQNCPQQYEPHGFKPTTHDQILYPRDDSWRKETQSCGIMDAGCHRVGLKVTSLKCTREDADDEEAGTRQIPDTLKYSEKVDRESEVGLVCEEPSSQSLTHGSDERSSQESIQVPESTQRRQDAITKGMLQKMLEVPPPDSELTPTQVDSYFGSNSSKTTSGAKPCLSQAQTSKIKQRVNLSQSTQIAGDKNLQSGRHEVNCQCGWSEPEPDMVYLSAVDLSSSLTHSDVFRAA
ncbi:meiosis specific protein Hop1, putative [Trichophyton verrucosum HKI 0517]|uniref:Meiosis specific protein Hop1, putative n=1 Tax=Trichophyton verrucosum (strain HKI 0517) TaxID=663202 RepID=D4DA33_TRIVH|nr:meiosis specific protein Hop1, putative [Trichophyton verrucosum HKI 0517]EFE41270.1 meiosis specific protein Hop1, putative [Trichophyton verrucosum HKI 0517]